MAYWLEMAEERSKAVRHGRQPGGGGPNAGFERRALAKLKWMVVRDMVETETASFWYDSPEVKRGDLVTADIDTEVFLMPAAGHAEKAGTFTNTQRLLQFREKAVDPPGEARSELWFVHHLARRLKEKARGDARPRNAGLNALTWDYVTSGPPREPDAEESAPRDQRLRRGRSHAGPRLRRAQERRHDRLRLLDLRRRVPGPGLRTAPRPAMRRARTARAGASPGRRTGASSTTVPPRVPTASPGARRRSSCGGTRRSASGPGSTPGFHAHQAARLHASSERHGDEALAGDKPFLLHADGLGWIWVPVGLRDGPLPAHYEPWESPVMNPLTQPNRTTRPRSNGSSPATCTRRWETRDSRTCSPRTG
jgi:formate dehydrogenase major subunit